MAVWFGILSAVLLVMYCREQGINRSLNHELLYLRERLGHFADVSGAGDNGYILVPSENMGIRELAAQLNRVLEKFYLQKADYQRARHAMEQVLTNISHDLRTPLTVLKGYSELLVKEGRKEPEAAGMRDMAAKIDQKADELVETINEYFTMSKIESGDRKVELQRMNLTQLCNEVILDYYDILEEKQYEVEIGIGSAPVFVNADGEAVRRILKNLIENAVRYGGSGKYLGIRLKNLSGNVMVEIEDHGSGIAGRDQDRIFSRNYTTAHRGSGSGLGLAIAKNLAMLMEADIRVDSDPGRGTVFALCFKC